MVAKIEGEAQVSFFVHGLEEVGKRDIGLGDVRRDPRVFRLRVMRIRLGIAYRLYR